MLCSRFGTSPWSVSWNKRRRTAAAWSVVLHVQAGRHVHTFGRAGLHAYLHVQPSLVQLAYPHKRVRAQQPPVAAVQVNGHARVHAGLHTYTRAWSAPLILEGPRMPVTEVSHAYTIYTTHMMQERKPIFSKRILMNTLMKQEEARKAAAKKLIESS